MVRQRDKLQTPPPEEPTGPEPGALPRFLARTLWVFAVLGVLLPLVAAKMAATARQWQNAWHATLIALLGTIAIEAGLVFLARWLIGPAFDEARRRLRAVKESKLLCHETRRILKRHGYRVKPEIARDIAGHEEALRQALKERNWERIRAEMNALDELVDKHLSFARKSTVREYAESIGVAVLIALLLRSFVVEAFKIPSGSMYPTLKVGDHIFVNKFIYGLGWPLSGIKFWQYGRPSRGDVIVFKYPEDPDKDFIKRVIGVEGDTVEIRRTGVFVNGKALPRRHLGYVHYIDYSDELPIQEKHPKDADEWEETLDGKTFQIYTEIGENGGGCRPPARFGCGEPAKVPPSHVYVMGDNRDNSHDSRFWGYVPLNFIKGKALFVWYSGDPDPDKKWLSGIRVERFGHIVR